MNTEDMIGSADSIRQQAIDDCRYAKSLGETALHQHFMHWRDFEGYSVPLTDYEKRDILYYRTISEIASKLNTTECLLEN